MSTFELPVKFTLIFDIDSWRTEYTMQGSTDAEVQADINTHVHYLVKELALDHFGKRLDVLAKPTPPQL